jgi:molybdopterin/thiamine biosynthesis adenylyltransferase
LGGYLAESFARLGVRKITLIDPDTFQIKNLNRQRFAITTAIGENKVDVTKVALLEINPDVFVQALHTTIERCYHDLILNDADLIVDAVDAISTKCYIETLAKSYNVPLLHGAVGGWYGQFAMITHHNDLLNTYYGNAKHGIETMQKCPTFIPVVIAGMMVAEWIHFITSSGSSEFDTVYFYDAKTRSLDAMFNQET